MYRPHLSESRLCEDIIIRNGNDFDAAKVIDKVYRSMFLHFGYLGRTKNDANLLS